MNIKSFFLGLFGKKENEPGEIHPEEESNLDDLISTYNQAKNALEMLLNMRLSEELTPSEVGNFENNVVRSLTRVRDDLSQDFGDSLEKINFENNATELSESEIKVFNTNFRSHIESISSIIIQVNLSLTQEYSSDPQKLGSTSFLNSRG